MKKTLSLLLALTLVVSLFASVGSASAASLTAGEQLKAIGVIKGDTSGSLNETSTWDKQDLAVLLSRLAGKEEVAAATAKSHTFADVADDYYDGYISWAKASGYITGISATEFGFNEPVTYKVLNAVILRVLGYDTTGANYDNTEDLAVSVGISEATDFDAAAIRGIAYGTILKALETNVKGTEKSLGLTLGIKSFVDAAAEKAAAEAAAAKPQVVSVTAINATQIIVKFNVAVTSASATTLSNYKIGANSPASAVLSEDAKSVTLTFAQASSVEVSGAAVIVEPVVTAADATVNTARYTALLTFEDTVKPVISSVTSTATTLTVNFSEPLSSNVTVLRVNGAPVTANNITAGATSVTATVSLTAGSTATVYAAGAVDQGGNVMDLYNGSVVVALPDTTAPAIASITQSAQNVLKVVFTEAVTGFTSADVKLLDGTTLITSAATVAIDNTDTTGKTYLATLDLNGATAGDGIFAAGVTSKGFTVLIDASAYADTSANASAAYIGAITLAQDLTAPAFVSAAVNTAGDKVALTFSEAITSPTVTGAVVTDANGVRIAASDVSIAVNGSDSKVADLDINGQTVAIAAGTYTIVVPAGAVQDALGNASAAFTATVTVGAAVAPADTTAPTVTIATTATNTFRATFSEEVTPATAVNLANYKLDGAALPTGTAIYFTSVAKTVVEIVLPAGSINVGNQTTGAAAILTVSNAKDLAGNTAATTSAAVTVKDNTAATIASTQVIGTDVFVTFTEDVVLVDTDNTTAGVQPANATAVFGITNATATGAISAVAGNAKQVKFSITAAPTAAAVITVVASQAGVTDANGVAVK